MKQPKVNPKREEAKRLGLKTQRVKLPKNKELPELCKLPWYSHAGKENVSVLKFRPADLPTCVEGQDWGDLIPALRLTGPVFDEKGKSRFSVCGLALKNGEEIVIWGAEAVSPLRGANNRERIKHMLALIRQAWAALPLAKLPVFPKRRKR